MTPADIHAVAAVVTGGQRRRLTEEQRDTVIRAMHALGYSRDHVAWVLRLRPQTAVEYAHRLGVRLHLHDQRHDPTAVWIVCCGVPMRLRGADLDEAIRLLAPTRTALEIARLTQFTKDAISRRASRLGVSTKHQWSYTGRPARQPQPARQAA